MKLIALGRATGFESFSKRRTPGVCGAMSKMFVGGC